MKISPNDFEIKPNIKIADLPTKLESDKSKSELKDLLSDTRKELGDMQNMLYAHGKYSVLVCIQGMDTAGKDSMIREVFKDFNVRGVNCYSFKKPTEEELNHDYLWRHYKKLPQRGRYAVFNRTHYENVLVAKVHPQIVLNENIPTITKLEDVDETFWKNRYNQINQFEKTIHESGTIIFKFFLNLSKDEQKHRLKRRLDKPEKNWKFSPQDLEERKKWDKYASAYEDAINATSKPHSPWYNIPADNKKMARYIVAKILLERMSTYTDIQYPKSDLKENVEFYKKQLENE
jgi:PPK2 family polyphosphate:nucleotide phosphotransferase